MNRDDMLLLIDYIIGRLRALKRPAALKAARLAGSIYWQAILRDDPHHERRMAMASALPGKRIAEKGLDPRLPDAGGLAHAGRRKSRPCAYVAG